MKEKKEKIYLPSSIKNIDTKFGSMMIANLKVEDLKANSKNGWISMVIAERKEPSEKGATHYAYVNDYEPKQKEESSSNNNTDAPF
tara:strand:- start:376 stop:633 length:258 start_codon:yes stop_codon:yes gene_type:complete